MTFLVNWKFQWMICKMKIKLNPVLLDSLVANNCTRDALCKINDKWYIAKPLDYYSLSSFFARFYHAWLVIRNKAHVYQYAQDYFDKTA